MPIVLAVFAVAGFAPPAVAPKLDPLDVMSHHPAAVRADLVNFWCVHLFPDVEGHPLASLLLNGVVVLNADVDGNRTRGSSLDGNNAAVPCY